MVTETLVKSNYSDPWELLSQARRRNLYSLILYLLLSFIMLVTDISQNNRLDRSYQREIEYNKQIATLIAENRRLRGNCPTGLTPSRGLANNQPNRR